MRGGETLFEEGSLGTSMYMLAHGGMKATHKMESGEEEDLAFFKAGAVFGEIALIMDMPRTASIRCTENDTLLLELKKDDFRAFLKLLPNTMSINDVVKKRTTDSFKRFRVPFFEAIPDDKYHQLAQLCTIEQCPPDTVLFREGDIGTKFYILAHGQVAVRGVREGVDKLLTTIGPGKYFGEIALVQERPRTATVITLSRCVILSITKENFQAFFAEAPEAIADFEVKILRAGVQFRSVLYHGLGFDSFLQHCKSEYSTENIEFWRDCRYGAGRDTRAVNICVVLCCADGCGLWHCVLCLC